MISGINTTPEPWMPLQQWRDKPGDLEMLQVSSDGTTWVDTDRRLQPLTRVKVEREINVPSSEVDTGYYLFQAGAPVSIAGKQDRWYLITCQAELETKQMPLPAVVEARMKVMNPNNSHSNYLGDEYSHGLRTFEFSFLEVWQLPHAWGDSTFEVSLWFGADGYDTDHGKHVRVLDEMISVVQLT